jgi:glycosyltransferase involved in cell wall biosynthesis
MDTLQFIKYLQETYDVLLITGGGEKDEFEAAYLTEHLGRVRIERLPNFKRNINLLNDWRTYRHVKKILQDFKPDIVHTHNSKSGLVGRWAAHQTKVPVILHTYHGLLFHGYFNPWLTWLLKKIERKLGIISTRLIALSQSQKNELVQEHKIADAAKIEIVPLGIEVQNFQQQLTQKRDAFRKKYLLADDEVAVGIVGRIVPIKNHSMFLQVAAKLLQKSKTKVRFFIIGNGELRKKLEQECVQLNISKTYFPSNPIVSNITFTSWITEIEKAIAGLDIVALTSINEGTPVSLIEAQAAGKPVIATVAGGIEDVMLNNQTGFCIAQNDVDAYCEKLERLIENAELRKQMGDAGFAFVEHKFSKTQQVNLLDSLYKKLMQEKTI